MGSAALAGRTVASTAPVNGGDQVWLTTFDANGDVERRQCPGTVLRRERPSHIRRGRLQADPWWIAVPSGTAEPLTDVGGDTRWFQTRREAVRALMQVVPA